MGGRQPAMASQRWQIYTLFCILKRQDLCISYLNGFCLVFQMHSLNSTAWAIKNVALFFCPYLG